jgi:putative chitinase
MIDHDKFFDKMRPLFGGPLTQTQVEGMSNILHEWERRLLIDPRWLAYMLATTKHETADTMQPVREYGSEAYLRSKPYYPWVGEGLVQVTWQANHRKFGATAPGHLLKWPDCLVPLFDGMIKGLFTGVKLSTYFNATRNDPVNARKIINGLDRAGLIAGYHRDFLAALKA